MYGPYKSVRGARWRRNVTRAASSVVVVAGGGSPVTREDAPVVSGGGVVAGSGGAFPADATATVVVGFGSAVTAAVVPVCFSAVAREAGGCWLLDEAGCCVTTSTPWDGDGVLLATKGWAGGGSVVSGSPSAEEADEFGCVAALRSGRLAVQVGDPASGWD